LPELQVETSPATRGEADRLRLFEAALELFQHARGEAKTFVFDDLQYSDAASVEAFDYLLARVRQDPKTTLVAMIGFRRGELTRETVSWVDRALESGRATLIELSGLEPSAIWELAEALATDARDQVPDLERVSLGNPLFVSEILRSKKSESGAKGVPPRIERLLERRLERLSPAALRLARVAVILGSELTVEVAARVMDLPPLELDEPWAELEREQVLTNRRFAHDLLAETLEKSLSRALFSYLHGRAANELAKENASAAVIARHFVLAEDDLGAAPHLMRAGEQLRTLSRLAEAADAFERAGDIFLEHGDMRNAMRGWFAVGRFLRGVDRGERFQRLVNRMSLHARNDAERARYLVVRAFYDEVKDDLDSAVRHAGQALELSTVLGHAIPRAEALRIIFIARTRQGRLRDAEVALESFTEMCRAVGRPEAELAALWHGAELYAAHDRHLEAIELCTRADRLVAEIGQFGYVRVVMQGLLAHSYLALGRTSDAAAILEGDPSAPGMPANSRVRVEWCLAVVDIAHGRYRTADERLLQLLDLVPNWSWESRVRVMRGALLCWLGAAAIGKNELLIAIDEERTDALTRIDAMLALGRESPETLSNERRTFIRHSGSPLQRGALACLGSPSEAELARLRRECEELGARGHTIALDCALAELWAKGGEHARAKALVDRAFSEARQDPPVFPELEKVALVRAMLHESAEVWADAERVVQRAEVPKAWEQSYREKNPVIAAILARR
jgi:tetratricopeptide (TPR) repeat protein